MDKYSKYPKARLAPIKCRNFSLNFDRTLVMGVLNVTPDSFSDGGKFLDAESAVTHSKRMVNEGADIIDVGGGSSRPGAEPVPDYKEIKRVKPVIKKLTKEINVPISIDTCKPKVAEECLRLGAHIINDITGLGNKEMIKVAAEYNAPVVLMHMKGTPKEMQQNPTYNDVVKEIKGYFKSKLKDAEKAGIRSVILDPGIGFGKSTEHNLTILKRLNEFKSLKRPILVGPSRKSFIGNITGLGVSNRLEGTLASVSIAVMNGANIVRVHDVKECKRAVQVSDAIKGAGWTN